jgi:hypothetical protein
MNILELQTERNFTTMDTQNEITYQVSNQKSVDEL